MLSSPATTGKVLEFVLDQVVNPEDFLKKVKELYAEPEMETLTP